MTSKFLLHKLRKILKSPKKVLFALGTLQDFRKPIQKSKIFIKKCEKVLDKIIEVR